MSITVTLRGGSGDMTKDVYDPNLDGLIAAAQLASDVMVDSVEDVHGVLPIREGGTFKDTADVTKSAVTAYNSMDIGYTGSDTRGAFKHTVSEEWVESVKVKLRHAGTAIAHTPVYVRIRKVSDDSIVAENLICYQDDQILNTDIIYTATFTTPVYVNEECYFCVETATEAGAGQSFMWIWGKTGGGDQNIWGYIAAWSQAGAGYSVYGVIAYKKQIGLYKI